MTIPRAACLSLLLALLFCAFAAQSASAVPAKNTTWVTCVGEAGEVDFSDSHCDKKVATGHGLFGHFAIPNGVTIVTLTNAKTASETTAAAPTILKGTVFGVKNEITCKTVSGEAELSNSEPEAKWHLPKWLSWVANLTGCTVNKPSGFGCKVKEPIQFKLTGEGVEGLGAGKNEMGMEFKPTAGEVFAEYTIEGCFMAGTYKLTGTAIGTGTPAPTEQHTGATNVFTNAMTKETLKLAGNPVELSSSATYTMANGGNPISLTTTT